MDRFDVELNGVGFTITQIQSHPIVDNRLSECARANHSQSLYIYHTYTGIIQFEDAFVSNFLIDPICSNTLLRFGIFTDFL